MLVHKHSNVLYIDSFPNSSGSDQDDTTANVPSGIYEAAVN